MELVALLGDEETRALQGRGQWCSRQADTDLELAQSHTPGPSETAQALEQRKQQVWVRSLGLSTDLATTCPLTSS